MSSLFVPVERRAVVGMSSNSRGRSCVIRLHRDSSCVLQLPSVGRSSSFSAVRDGVRRSPVAPFIPVRCGDKFDGVLCEIDTTAPGCPVDGDRVIDSKKRDRSRVRSR